MCIIWSNILILSANFYFLCFLVHIQNIKISKTQEPEICSSETCSLYTKNEDLPTLRKLWTVLRFPHCFATDVARQYTFIEINKKNKTKKTKQNKQNKQSKTNKQNKEHSLRLTIGNARNLLNKLHIKTIQLKYINLNN